MQTLNTYRKIAASIARGTHNSELGAMYHVQALNTLGFRAAVRKTDSGWLVRKLDRTEKS